MSSSTEQPNWDPDTQCMDSTQMWFCRDLWVDAAKNGLKKGRRGGHNPGKGHKRSLDESAPIHVKRDAEPAAEPPAEQKRVEPVIGEKRDGQADGGRADEDTGTDVDAIDEDANNPAPEPLKHEDLPASAFLAPNSVFTAARILVNPRCVTTYGGVSHTQLALDLFGTQGGGDQETSNYVLEDWAGPPDSFVCQEMRTTGGRTAPKSQRRVGFLLQNEVSGTVHTRGIPMREADLQVGA
jgi:hypothetical protein